MRPPRIDFPGARHHVMNRGARRRPVFIDDRVRALFLDVLEDLPRRFGVRVHGYALMPNHYHLMLESQHGTVSRAMRHLGGTFTQRLNTIHEWDGPVFRGRYRNRLVDHDSYWRHLLIYLHLNPHRAGIPSFEAHDWTSHRAYLGDVAAPAFLTTAELQELYGDAGNYTRAYEAARCGAAPPPNFDADRLWAPNNSGRVGPPIEMASYSAADALDEVRAVTSMSTDDLLGSAVGRGGNPANWLTAWWMSERGIDHGEIKRAMGVSHSAVSRRIRRIRQRLEEDGKIARWAEQLRQDDSSGGC